MSNATIDHHHKDQSGRGNVQNGLEQKNSRGDEFESTYMPQSNMNQNYGMAPTSESYMPSYYGQMPFQYMGGSEWSTGGDSMPYLSGYGGEAQQHSFMPDAMFGHPPNQQLGNTQQAYFNQPYNFLPASNDFSAWGAPPSTGHGSAGMADNSRNPSFGQQSVTAPSYTADYYHSIMPATPHDYLGGGEGMPSMGNNMLGHIAGSANMPPLGSSNAMPGAEHMGKLPVGTSANGSKMVEQGLQNIGLGVASMTVDPMKAAPQQSLAMPLNVGPVVSSGQNQSSNLSGQGGNNGNPPGSNAPKPVSWAAIASKPAKPQPKPKVKGNVGPGLPPPIKHNMDIGSWDTAQPPPPKGLVRGQMPGQPTTPQRWTAPRQGGPPNFNPSDAASNGQYPVHSIPNESNAGNQNASASPAEDEAGKAILEKLKSENDYNPKRLTLDIRNARFFVIKSYSEDDIHRSIKYNIWCSTEHGNKRLDAAFRAQQGRGPVILLYSVNGSGHFCGVAEMLTPIDYSKRAGVWAQDKWKGKFQVKWIYAKDVPNSLLRHIRLENNENKPVTNSRDTQEVLAEKGRQVLKIISQYKHQTSIFDDFSHYERRQMEEDGIRAKRSEQSRARENNRRGDSRADSNKNLPQQDQVEQISPRN